MDIPVREQSATETPENQLPQNNKLNQRGSVPILIGMIILLIVVTGGAYYLGTLREKLPLQNPVVSSQNPQPTPVPSTPSIKVTGVLRNSGLTKDEKVTLNLNSSNYQITDFGIASDNSKIMGYFLETDNSEYRDLEGKCVEITGSIKQSWEDLINNQFEINNKYTYQRSTMIPQSINQLSNSACNPYSGNRTVSDSEIGNKRVLKGTVAGTQRPAPDIGYDYQLNLATPLNEEWGSTGGPVKVDKIDISPLNNSVWNILEDKMGTIVTVTGYKTWGYAESQYLLIIDVN
ncbi:MAG: hypothetical protein Q8P92_02695 [Candidatus Daviesbacteria bacterium]|nr:hypothetical protein [Candidatus Daviesbacteria bacterium]